MLSRRKLLLGGTAFAAAAAVTSVSFPAFAQSDAAPAGEEVIAWLKANAMPLASAEPGAGFADLAALREIIGDARIVGLGEATHGTREFFQLKHRLIEYCVSELGFTMIGFEAEYGATLAVNEYVLGGKGKASDFAGGMGFWTWDTEEVNALIDWVRTWNASHDDKVKFYGFDMQSSAAATMHMLAYLERVAPELAATTERKLAPLASYMTQSDFAGMPPAMQDEIFDQIETVLDEFKDRRGRWTSRSSEIEWSLARQSAVMLDQFTRHQLVTDDTKSFNSRDRAMADNVRKLLNLEGEDSRMVLWAHNGHMKKEEYFNTPAGRFDAVNMGSLLDDEFGDDYVVVGFAFNQGSFQAIGAADGSSKLMDHTVGPASAGFMDAALAATGIPLFALDLTSVPTEGPVDEWMDTDPLQRFIGAVFRPDDVGGGDQYAVSGDPRDNYDVLIFVERTTAARGNKRPSLQIGTATGMNKEPTNLALAGSGGMPDGWGAMVVGLAPYTMTAVDDESRKGGKAMRIARADSALAWGDGVLMQSFPAAGFAGRQLVFSAAMRADAPRIGTGPRMVVKVFPKRKEGSEEAARAIMAVQEDGAVRSSEWTRRSIAVDIPADADRIQISLVVTGTSAGSFGDLELAAAGSPQALLGNAPASRPTTARRALTLSGSAMQSSALKVGS
jgi:erythromycin esterase